MQQARERALKEAQEKKRRRAVYIAIAAACLIALIVLR